jgi:membrane protein YdbS with pleckstrin-like domain
MTAELPTAARRGPASARGGTRQPAGSARRHRSVPWSAQAKSDADTVDRPLHDDGSAVSQRLNVAALDDTTQWRRVSPKYVWVVIVGSLISGLIAAAIAVFAWLVLQWGWAWIALAVIVVIAIVQLIIAPRRARAIGYILRDDDLLIRRGIMFQRFVAVPYGRMQLLDIERGPIDRMLGLAELKFVTAAASSRVSIPGLAESDAAWLRDRLVELAESRRTGL